MDKSTSRLFRLLVVFVDIAVLVMFCLGSVLICSTISSCNNIIDPPPTLVLGEIIANAEPSNFTTKTEAEQTLRDGYTPHIAYSNESAPHSYMDTNNDHQGFEILGSLP